MDGSGVCYEQLGYGATFTSHHWILHNAPPPLFFFGGTWEKNCDGALIWRVVMTKWLNVGKLENILAQKGDNRPTFWYQIHKLPLTQILRYLPQTEWTTTCYEDHITVSL